MSHWWFCCKGGPRECLICSDDFNRPNSTDILPFVEKSGDWSIEDGALKAVDVGIAYCPTRHPVKTWTGIVQVKLVGMELGKKYEVLINYDPDGGSYESATLDCDGANTATLSLSSGDSIVVPYDPGDNTLTLCRAPNVLLANFGSHTIPAWDNVESPSPASRLYAGLRNPASGTIHFDDFTFWEHLATNPICPDCECNCEGYYPPKTLLATFLTEAEECSDFNGSEIPLEFERSGEGFRWRGIKTLPTCYPPFDYPEHIDWDLVLACYGTSPDQWMLENRAEPPTCCCVGWNYLGPPRGYGASPASYTCDPFQMEFGPFLADELFEEYPSTCEYRIVITEAPPV